MLKIQNEEELVRFLFVGAFCFDYCYYRDIYCEEIVDHDEANKTQREIPCSCLSRALAINTLHKMYLDSLRRMSIEPKSTTKQCWLSFFMEMRLERAQKSALAAL